jgi:general secretion pathway protein G
MRYRHVGLGRVKRLAFTLTEMLLVITIIGVLAGVLVTGLSGHTKEARVARAKADITGSIALALDLFERDLGKYPTTEEGLKALVESGSADWRGPYLKGGLKNDPWNHPYTYACQEQTDDPSKPQRTQTYTLSSNGADGQPGTPDDVTQ